MKKRLLILLLPALLLAVKTAGAEQEEDLCREIRVRIDGGHPVAGERIFNREGLRLFYDGQDCRTAWSAGGIVRAEAGVLLDAIRGADREGLNPADYHTARITALREEGSGGWTTGNGSSARDRRVDLDLLLTDAFFLYAAHLTGGRVNPVTFDPSWNIPGRGRDLVYLLRSALRNRHLAETMRGLPPTTAGYPLLREALAATRAVAAGGGWPIVPLGPALRNGDRDPRILALRRRLAATGELQTFAPDDRFDGGLAEAVRSFQRRHGLEDDGVVGSRTLTELNTPATLRVRQLLVNLEYLRWLPRNLGRRRLMVNIPDFQLVLIEDDAVIMEMRVIAGRQARRTPFFSSAVTSIVLNPSWSVPDSILIEDKLPLILDDRDYLRDQHFRVYRVRKNLWIEMDPADIDWVTLASERFPFRLRQDHGPFNSLGRIKFQIPNPYDIYLHDTPSKELFARTERTFSSGCIRVERALDLAETLLRAAPSWNRRRLEEEIARGKTVTVSLPEPMPIYLLYWTSWIGRDGMVHYREDIYGRDAALEEALAKPLAAR